MNAPKVTIIVLNWNGKADTMECMDSLRKVTYPNYKILLVDNASTDGSVELFKKSYPDIELIVSDKNLGFAGGNNLGIRRAMEDGADMLLLLNNDTTVYPDFLDGLVLTAQSDERIGIVGPKICFYGDPQKVWSAGGAINMFTGAIGNIGEGLPQDSLQGLKRVDYVSGCALLIKSSVVRQIGLMDEDYFLYFEETDWNVRAHEKGYISVVNNDVRILHKSGMAVRKAKDSEYYYVPRNLPLFIRKNGRWYHKLTFYPIFLMRYAFSYVLHMATGEPVKSQNIVKGIKDFVKKRYGKQ